MISTEHLSLSVTLTSAIFHSVTETLSYDPEKPAHHFCNDTVEVSIDSVWPEDEVETPKVALLCS